jgi:hypothetical protein
MEATFAFNAYMVRQFLCHFRQTPTAGCGIEETPWCANPT